MQLARLTKRSTVFRYRGMGIKPPGLALVGHMSILVATLRLQLATDGLNLGGSRLAHYEGSNLPTSGAVNPASTIGATIVRAAKHLRDNFADLRCAQRSTPAWLYV
jgi:hypothetical protein